MGKIKDIRTINNFCTSTHVDIFSDVEYKLNKNVNKNISDLIKKYFKDLNKFHIYWVAKYNNQLKIKLQYKLKPIVERKDNKDAINYSKYPGSATNNTIRYPKKNRKTAWKRFFKLFPHLKVKHNEK